MTLGGVALIALIVAADAHDAWLDYRRTLSDNERNQQALSRVLAEQTARMIQEADIVLSDYAQWVVSPEGRAADNDSLSERLRADVMRLPFVLSAALTGTDGRVLATTDSGTMGVVTIPPAALQDSLYIGRPFSGAFGGARTFVLSRRIEDAEDDFSGVVVTGVQFEYLTNFYASLNAMPDTTFRLFGSDGVGLVQYPANIGAPLNVPLEQQMQTYEPHAKEQVRYLSADGREQVAALHAIEGYPVNVEVMRPLSSVLRPWVRDAWGSAARTLMLVVLSALLLIALRTALSRRARVEHERRRLESELENARRLDALGILAASVAHDFNNVLSAIVGYGELARKSAAEGSADLANIDRLLAAAERARLLVRRVLTFDPRRSRDYAPLDLEPVITEVTQQIQATLTSSVTIELQKLDPSATILGDATEVHQVVMNLATNAVHAMPSGGRLTIQLQRVDIQVSRTVTLGQLLPGPWVCVSIADSGVGLSQEQIQSIFEPFYTTRCSESGTGIGLTVVRNILARMHGALEVQSRAGMGTRMSVFWPWVAAGQGVGTSTALPHAGHGETVLVVDDEPELVGIAEEVLALLGYEPVGFTGSRAALKAFRSQPERFDAVLTDERMVGLSGCELAKKIHKIEPELPVILVTGYRDADTLLRAKEAGVVEILDKPLSTQSLRAALARQLTAAKLPEPTTQ